MSRSKPELSFSALKGTSDAGKVLRSLLGQCLPPAWMWSMSLCEFPPIHVRLSPCLLAAHYICIKAYLGNLTMFEFLMGLFGGLGSCLIDSSPVLVIGLFCLSFEGFSTLLN